MKFFMSKRPFVVRQDPPIVVRVKQFLDKARAGEIFSTQQLAAQVGCCVEPLRSCNDSFSGYFCLTKNKKYWGNKRTIMEFQKELKKQ